MPIAKRYSLYKLPAALTVWGSVVFANSHAGELSLPAMQQTQTQLKQLDNKIALLQKTLTSAKDRRGALNKELSLTEKQIGEGIRQLHLTQQDIKSNEQKIVKLQNKVDELTKQLGTQQALLAHHVQARYQMGEYQPLKWIINQEDPHKINRILTYYQYIIKSRQQLISHIDLTQQALNESKTTLHDQLLEKQQLNSQLTQHQHQLEQNKKYHTALIRSLDNEIETNESQLEEAQKNKHNLTRILKQLAQQSTIATQRSFLTMRRKLPLPIATHHRNAQKMNNGVTFFADEGTEVTAVYPGKIVFSDWLKGYGLLLIIDHGNGFMTLYAHNQSLLKRKGEYVEQNERIANVGHTGGIKQNGLYFEVRQRGKAISPLEWLA